MLHFKLSMPYLALASNTALYKRPGTAALDKLREASFEPVSLVGAEWSGRLVACPLLTWIWRRCRGWVGCRCASGDEGALSRFWVLDQRQRQHTMSDR